MENFGKGSMLNNLNLKPHNIVVAYTSEIDYEMHRMILAELKGEYLILDGSHCSCYDFDETDWCGTLFTRDELMKLATVEYNSKSPFWSMVRVYFGI